MTDAVVVVDATTTEEVAIEEADVTIEGDVDHGTTSY
jgi:hypothetical protein